MRVGYIRVSSEDQNTARQLDGVQLDKTFTDKLSGKNTDRPQLQECLRFVRQGDTLIIHSLDRLARNLVDLRTMVLELTSRGVTVEFATQGLRFTGDDSPMNMLLLNMLGAVAEFERAQIRERQREGIALAKQRGVYKGRPRAVTDEQIAAMRESKAAGVSVAEIARQQGVSRETVYQYLQ